LGFFAQVVFWDVLAVWGKRVAKGFRFEKGISVFFFFVPPCLGGSKNFWLLFGMSLAVSPDLSSFEAFVEDSPEGLHRLTLMVEGVHCAACIQKIESALGREPGIKTARLNFSTKRLTIEWTGDAGRAREFVRTVSDLGYRVLPFDPKAVQAESDEEERLLQMCLGVAGFASGNIMLISFALWTTDIQVMGMATRDLLHWLSALIAIPAVLWSGQPYFRSALSVLKKGQTNMDVPISLGVLGACAVSLSETIRHGEHAYFDSAVMLLFFLLIGRYLDFRARRRARGAASGLLAMMAGTATVIDGDRPRVIPIRDLRQDMIVQVPMGARIPADGTVIEGETDIDTSLVTGETAPRSVAVGGNVFAGTLNLSAPIKLRVTAASKDSLLSDIVRLMEQAEQGQAKYVRIADRASRLYTPVVHFLAAATFLGWWLGTGLAVAPSILVAITVLIITCPCALGLAVPVVQVLATGRLMKRNILVKSGDAMERLGAIDTVIFDKTGTLTLGKPQLENKNEIAPRDLQLAASLAAHSHHPLSKAIAQAWDGDLIEILEVREIPGKGLEAQGNGAAIRLGSRAWCGENAAAGHDGQEIWLAKPNGEKIRFLLRDVLRSDAAETIQRLKDLHITPVLLSGDRQDVARKVAIELGIEMYDGELTPVDKYNRMEGLKKAGHKILMVGDGLNDAPTLVGANVSMSPSSAIDMAQNAADIVFMGDKLSPVVEAYRTATFSQKLVKENFALAIIYNVIAVPLAIAGFVTPMIAAIAMSSSSLIVIANSFRLSRMK
jgi:Cu2+-exporting ATPase